MSATDFTKLIAYAGTHQKRLLTSLVNGLGVVNDVTVRPGIKVAESVSKLTANGQARSYTGVHTPKPNALKYADRKLEVQIGQYDISVEPLKYRSTWMSEVMKPGVNPLDIPFEATVMQAVTDDFASQINDQTVFNGVFAAGGGTAASIATGFNSILKAEITAENVVPEVLGSMLTDTVAKIEELYKSLPARYRSKKMEVYVSYDVYDAYCEDYQVRFDKQPIYDGFNQVVVRHSQGNAVLRPCTWMGASQRVIITPKTNMLLGTDTLSDASKINSLAKMYSVDFGILLAIGFQIEDLEPLAVNEQE